MGLPSFLCIGAQKAGTTWLDKHLRSHPSIWLPPIKELHYFDHLFVPQNRRWTYRHLEAHARRAIARHIRKVKLPDLDFIKYLTHLATESPFTESWFRYVYDRPNADGKEQGDVTPAYAGIGEEGIDYVRSLLGDDVKIIYIIRDPVDRAMSQLRMNVARRRGAIAETWMELATDKEIRARSAYSVYIPQWKAAFAAKRLLFIPFRRIADKPLSVLREIETFLGIGPHNYNALDQRVHASLGSLQPPEEVIDMFEKDLATERSFVLGEFGEQFARMT